MDVTNGVFEAIGAVLLTLNIRRIYLDKKVEGISIYPTIHWTLWGYWNLFYYPSLGQWYSFYAGLAVVIANTIWLILVYKFRR